MGAELKCLSRGRRVSFRDSVAQVGNLRYLLAPSHGSVVFWRALILRPWLDKMNDSQIRSVHFFARFVDVY